MEQPAILPVKKPELKGTNILKALLDRQVFISNYLTNGGTVRELKQMGLKFGKVDLQNDVSGRD